MKKQFVINKLDFFYNVFTVVNLYKLIWFLLKVILLFILSASVHITLAVPILLVLLAVYLRFLYKDLNNHPCKLMNLSLLLLINFAACYFIILHGFAIYYIPFCVISLLSIMLFNDLVISLILTLAVAVSMAFMEGSNFNIGLLSLISGILACLLLYGARRRVTLIRAGLIVGIVQALAAFFLGENWYVSMILAINGIVCGMIVLGLLPLFEWLFGIITNIKLLELADFNNPLLNRLMVEAPGTYHHSLIVGNLSEAACNNIGANSLLARIGAYYHDIGKLQKPEYFSENQGITGNKHDALFPSMSKLVIMNHVKDGIEIAAKYSLNQRIIDFVQCHHGNSLVYYFYRRALENLEDDEEVMEEGFRYPGPKPSTKETAIVMLADSVEAATRALKEPSPAKIKELVHKIINNKFIDGQLDECELTLKDLEKISSVFICILSGIYHTRVDYSNEENQNNHKKSSKENPHHLRDGGKNSP